MKKNEFSLLFESMLKNPDDVKDVTVSYDTGSIHITVYPIITGIFLSINEAAGTSIPFDAAMYSYELTTINQCMSGRCEFRHPGEAFSYISPQLTCIARKRRMNAFEYPLGYYRGFEISIIESLIDDEAAKLLNCFSIDINKLIMKYLSDTETCIGQTDNRLLNLFNELSLTVQKKNIGSVRLKVLEILSSLQSEDVIYPFNSHYLSLSQAALARKAHEMLTEDLSKHVAVKCIAQKLGVSETGLKNYFKEVYGSCISEYLKNKRMKYAADKLQNTSLSILDIANSIGYTNQGRFAKVFYDHYKLKPLEFRRKNSIKELR